MPIFDQGYQHWHGTTRGHFWRFLAISRQGVRSKLKGGFTRLIMIAAWLPAIALVSLMAVWGLVEQQAEVVQPILRVISLPPEVSTDPIAYRQAIWTICYSYFFSIQTFVAMILVVILGPGLISQDLRFNALPLYLSRPITRTDYFLGKFGVIALGLGSVVVIPTIAAYGMGLLFSLDPTVIVDTLPIFLGALAFASVIVLSTGTLILGLSSLSRSSRYVAAFWIGIWFVSSAVASALSTQHVVQTQLEYSRAQTELQRAFQPGIFGNRPNAPDPNLLERIRQADAARIEAYRNNPWQMVSFTGNLDRIKAVLLDTNSAWDQFAKIGSFANRPGSLVGEEPFFITTLKGPQYPWYWSGGILLGLMGASIWIMHRRVRSLDRLK